MKKKKSKKEEIKKLVNEINETSKKICALSERKKTVDISKSNSA